MNDKIDLVVPYVDSSDPNWQKLFEKYTPHKNEEGIDALNRFRGEGDFFRYFFRCIERNMPWINKIHLLVQSDSQVPKWVNRSVVHVVKHDEFIPEEFLPTFNSTTIEMFLWNIPDLSEYFIYTNDDTFVLRELQPEDFFSTDGKVLVSSRGIKDMTSIWGRHCVNNYCLIYDMEPEKYIAENTTAIAFKHTYRPYIKSLVKECYEAHKKKIHEGISMFRDYINHNVYIFDLYQIKNRYQLPCHIASTVINSFADNKTIDIFFKKIIYDILSLQDTTDKVNIYDNLIINSYFLRTYRYKSKYEL